MARAFDVKLLGSPISLISLLFLFSAIHADASMQQNKPSWDIMILPASLNRAGVISLVGGHGQILPLVIQISQEEQSRDGSHELTLTLDLPEQINVVESQGVYDILSASNEKESGRNIFSYKIRIANENLIGTVGSRVLSEWKTQSFFVKTSEKLDAGEAYIKIGLSDGKNAIEKKWPLELSVLRPPAKKPTHTVIGLWDYELNRSKAASSGVASLLADTGVNFIEKGDGVFAEAIKAKGITLGGYVHQSAFYQENFSDITADGKSLMSEYPCPQDIIALPTNAKIPGEEALVKGALLDGLATIDYEPTGFTGFCDTAIQSFKERNNVSAMDFAYLRSQLAKYSYQTFQVKDPQFTHLYEQWQTFRSQQAADYIGRLRQSLRRHQADARLAVTMLNSYADNSPQTAAIGANNAAMARFVDIVMPQLYMGYGGVAVRAVMNWSADWRRTLDAQKLPTQLWPVLLIRYAGASVANSPERVRQQMLASLASGANGIMLYYPSNMDAPYWMMLARTTEDIANYEDFYQDGRRVDTQFVPLNMPSRSEDVNMWPGFVVKIKNPDWAYTAHERNGDVLLTLFNLKEQGDITFPFSLPAGMKVVSVKGAKSSHQGVWQVAEREVGFILLKKNTP